MTPQEQQMLQGLTDRINQTDLAEKDPEAERYLQDTLGRNPDALYILAQTILVQQYALDQAKQQLADARNAAQQPQKHTSFLGNLLGLDNQPAPPPPPPQGQYVPVPNYAPPPPQYGNPYPPQQYGAPQYGGPQYGAPPQQGSFLRSAMQTATGVAAGALAFEGIESLMHGFGGHSSGSNFGSFGDSGRPEVVNNYYGDTPQHEHEHGLSSDIEDRRNDPPYFADDASDKSSANDFTSTDSDDNISDFGGGDDFSSSDDNS
ncbi:MAG: putative periplasmic ligand-binding sensor protein [Acidobacteriaceae bacterium]|nr:putative periplasmic ligand-binding sensor protein [Acidobacteriaceae bacterium]